ncbi:YolD-like family protein [Paenibacillaceae bacterium]|nr:YolD-like family protein [Paenibacillaceae bacterium]
MAAVPKTKKYKTKRPTRDEFQLEEMGERLVEAKEEKTELLLSIWGEETVAGFIQNMDSRTRLVHVLDRGGQLHKIPFLDIMDVNNASK